MKRVYINLSDRDFDLIKEEAGKVQMETDEFLQEFVSKALRPIRAERFKRMSGNQQNPAG